ncbi:hypothetical protein P8452_23247 [Trifolium repens]|nr:hypothetical protein P8452_23247 [Trifolium repens]
MRFKIDDAIIKRKGFIFFERQIVKTSGKDDLEVALHGTWNWLKRWFSTSLLARPLFSVFRFFVHIGLEYMFTHSGLQAEFPPNTNILYVDLPFAELVGLSKNVNNIPLPGIVLNTRKPMVYVDQFGRQCRGSQLEALEIQPPPLILLPTVIAAFSNRRRSQAITDMHSAAFMVSLRVYLNGIQFIESNFTAINDDKQHRPIGFDILFPSLIEYAQTLGINLQR